MGNETGLFYNNALKDFENLNTTTPSIYDLGDHEVLIVLKDGTNLSSWDDVEYLRDILYISEDLSAVCDLSSYYYEKASPSYSDFHISPFRKLKAIVAQNVQSDVISLEYMFYKLGNITTISGLNSWNTSNVVDMRFLFAECKNLEVVSGIESIDIGNVRNMNSIFYGCEKLSNFNSLKSWDVKDVLDMDYMFAGCSSFNNLAPILDWDINGDCIFENMFKYCSVENRMAFYSNWQDKLLNSFSTVFYDLSKVVGCVHCGKFDMACEDGHLVCNNCGEILNYFPALCPDCGSDNLCFDFKQMEYYCKNCGLIIDFMEEQVPYFEGAYFNVVLDEDTSLKAKLDALDCIKNDALLYSFAFRNDSIPVMKRACENIIDQDYLVKIALDHPSSYIRCIACERIQDERVLTEIVCDDLDEEVSIEAIRHIRDDDFLCELVLNSENEKIRNHAIKGIRNYEILLKALHGLNSACEESLVANIENEYYLKRLLGEDISPSSKETALKKLKN